MAEHRTLTELPAGYRSPVVARLVWMLDEQRRALLADLRGLGAEDLSWQPAPGMNTAGMLFAHIAYAEAHLGQVGLRGESVGHAHDVIGLTEEEEGLPLAPGAPPSPALQGRPASYFADLLDRARAHTHVVARELDEPDLARQVTRVRPDGTRRVFDVGWVLFHLLEHEAAHHGQIRLLLRLRRGG